MSEPALRGPGASGAGPGAASTSLPGRPSTYRVVLPEGWRRIDLAPGRAERSVERLTEQVFRGQDDAPLLKRDLRAHLLDQVSQARGSGGIELFLSMMSAPPATLPASLLVSLTPPVADPRGPVPLEVLAEHLGAALEATEVDLVDLPAGRAVRRCTRRTVQASSMVARPDAHEGTPASDSAQATVPPPDMESLGVEYHVPVPHGSGSFLVLTFSSPLMVLAEALTGLFDAVAATLHWVWPTPAAPEAPTAPLDTVTPESPRPGDPPEGSAPTGHVPATGHVPPGGR